MEIIFTDYILQNKESKINLKINHNKITGITGFNYKNIIEAITLRKIGTGDISINGIKILKKNINVFQRRISYIKEELISNYFQLTIKDLMIEEIKENNLELNNENKKIIDSLKIVGLSKEYLNRNINTLSTYEKKLILLAVGLLKNPDLIIINEPFKGFDLNNEKRLYNLYNKIKEQYKKTLIFISNDSNTLYKYTEEMIFCKNDEILITGNTNELYEQVDYLKKIKMEIPDIVEITILARKNKNIKLSFHKDVRDIIKDIYKHV